MAAEFAAATELTGDGQVSVVASQYMLYNREPEADAAIFARPAAVYAEEALGKPWNLLRRNTLARVGYDDLRSLRVRTPQEIDRAVGRRVANRVRQKVRNQ